MLARSASTQFSADTTENIWQILDQNSRLSDWLVVFLVALALKAPHTLAFHLQPTFPCCRHPHCIHPRLKWHSVFSPMVSHIHRSYCAVVPVSEVGGARIVIRGGANHAIPYQRGQVAPMEMPPWALRRTETSRYIMACAFPNASWMNSGMERERVGCGVDCLHTLALFNLILALITIIADPPTRILKGSKIHCYECGQQCEHCQARTQRICSICSTPFCIEHDRGCDWRHVSTLTFAVHLSSLTSWAAVCLVQCWRFKRSIARLLKECRAGAQP